MTTLNCGDEFTDSGGSASNYSNNETRIYRICPTNPGTAVTANFSSFALKLNGYVAKYGNLQVKERTRVLVEELTKLNDILPKLNDIYARAYLKSLRSLAHAIAEVSGGLLGFLDISYEEKHLTALEMITYEP